MDEPTKTKTARPNRLAMILLGVAVLIVAAAVVVKFVLPDSAPAKEQLTDSTDASGKTIDPGSLDGTWVVVAGSGDSATYAGYRVEEVFAAGARRATAVGRTSAVTGELVVAADRVTTAKVTVDMTTLKSDEGRRDRMIRDRGVQTAQYPEATFELSEPVALPAMHQGKVVKVPVRGNLTLHGVTRPVTADLSVRPSGEVFTIDASVPIAFADYRIEAPSIGGFVSVEDKGSLEFRISFGRK